MVNEIQSISIKSKDESKNYQCCAFVLFCSQLIEVWYFHKIKYEITLINQCKVGEKVSIIQFFCEKILFLSAFYSYKKLYSITFLYTDKK
jgi:hypothetical protein